MSSEKSCSDFPDLLDSDKKTNEQFFRDLGSKELYSRGLNTIKDVLTVNSDTSDETDLEFKKWIDSRYNHVKFMAINILEEDPTFIPTDENTEDLDKEKTEEFSPILQQTNIIRILTKTHPTLIKNDPETALRFCKAVINRLRMIDENGGIPIDERFSSFVIPTPTLDQIDAIFDYFRTIADFATTQNEIITESVFNEIIDRLDTHYSYSGNCSTSLAVNYFFTKALEKKKGRYSRDYSLFEKLFDNFFKRVEDIDITNEENKDFIIELPIIFNYIFSKNIPVYTNERIQLNQKVFDYLISTIESTNDIEVKSTFISVFPSILKLIEEDRYHDEDKQTEQYQAFNLQILHTLTETAMLDIGVESGEEKNLIYSILGELLTKYSEGVIYIEPRYLSLQKKQNEDYNQALGVFLKKIENEPNPSTYRSYHFDAVDELTKFSNLEELRNPFRESLLEFLQKYYSNKLEQIE